MVKKHLSIKFNFFFNLIIYFLNKFRRGDVKTLAEYSRKKNDRHIITLNGKSIPELGLYTVKTHALTLAKKIGSTLLSFSFLI